MRKTKTDDVTPAKPVLSKVEGAGVQGEKLDSRWSLSRTLMRGGNDKYCFRNRNYIGERPGASLARIYGINPAQIIPKISLDGEIADLV